MSAVKQLLDSLLWDIYGKQQQSDSANELYEPKPKFELKKKKRHKKSKHKNTSSIMATNVLGLRKDPVHLQKLSVRKLIDICAILKVELRLMGYFLERVLISRDRNQRHQEILCGFVDAVLHVECPDAHTRMRFSLSPPPTKAVSTVSAATSPIMQHNKSTPQPSAVVSDIEPVVTSDDDAASDYKQWLHAMKLVARLPGGMPPEFRRKLWLSLADKYLKMKNVEWSKEEDKCFCEQWREDDEELGIQIVKDLHRTGSNLCTGPAGTINQAKLKRILLGYARYNPEVGYCQGFNMLGALILQVMDKEEAESMKVMIYLVEGVLPPGYFCGSMGGLQADMGVFRELMTSKLPRLAKHLQKLQGPVENAYEPPLTNVFTMQWFLTMFCTCLPMTCVLRVWDLVLIEGSDVLLRTALVLWSLLEERILNARTADDFYCKMGSFSSELLNGHLIDSNGLIEKVVQLGPIPDIQRLRDKHLYNIAPLRHKQGLQLYFDDEEPESDEESRLAVATVWGIPWGRRGSAGQTTNTAVTTTNKPLPENKDRIALDISLLKKQYDRLRERQKQAHIILTTACSTARQSNANPIQLPVNQLLSGRSAIVTNRGKRIGPLAGAIPPARKPSLPAILQAKPPEKQLRRGETLHWRDTDISKRRRDSLTWKEIKADRSASVSRDSSEDLQPRKLRTRLGKSDSSSYSEESDEDDDGSSTDTSLCDEDDPASAEKTAHRPKSVENSPKRRAKTLRKQKELSAKLRAAEDNRDSNNATRRPKSWAPSSDEIPFMLMTSDSPVHDVSMKRRLNDEVVKEEEDSATESDRVVYKLADDLSWTGTEYSPIAGDLATTQLGPLHIHTDVLELPVITSTSQLSPIPDITKYLNGSSISPLPTPKPLFLDSTNSLGSGDGDDVKNFDVNDDGVTNEYFERVNSVERPTKLDLFYSLSEEDSIRNAFESNDDVPILDNDLKPDLAKQSDEIEVRTTIEGCEANKIQTDLEKDKNYSEQRRMELLDTYSEKSSVACIAEATSEISSSLGIQNDHKKDISASPIESNDNGFPSIKSNDIKNYTKPTIHRKLSFTETRKKRRDPRRLTIARTFVLDTEDQLELYERYISDNKKVENKNDISTKIEEDPSDNIEQFNAAPSTKIPTTADLEDRFHRLEKQLSDRKDKSIEHTEGISQTDSIDVPSPTRSRIPSTEDLEDRFNALQKQMSTQNISHTKSIDIESSDIVSRNEEYKSSSENEMETTKDIEIDENKTALNARLTKHSSSAELEDSKELTSPSRLSIPSTADLESRFNAMEKQMSSKSISPKESTEITNIDEEFKDKIEENQIESENIRETKIDPNKIPIDDTNTTRSLTKHSSSAELEESKDLTRPSRSSIPSTADLESRFNAMEKQMSSKSINPKESTEITNIDEEFENKIEGTTSKETEIVENKTALNANLKKHSSSAELENSKDLTSPSRSSIPSTADLESRFNAMEKQMSSKSISPKESTEITNIDEEFENKIEENQKTSENICETKMDPNKKPIDDTNTIHKVDHTRKDSIDELENSIITTSTSRIPTTSELEDRINVLDRQMSSKSIDHPIEIDSCSENIENKENTFEKKSESATDKEESSIEDSVRKLKTNLEEACSGAEDSNDLTNPNRSRIPSTAYSEDRFETQISSKSNSPNKSIKISSTEKIENKNDENKSTSDNNQKVNTPDNESKTKTESAIKEVPIEDEKIKLKSSLTKIPSTAELEDRFNEMERKNNFSKISSPKTQKKPPDEKITTHKSPESVSAVSGKKIDSSKVEMEEKVHTTKADAIKEKNATLPKSPPSTEELEKRFKALEKTLSTTNVFTKDQVDDTSKPASKSVNKDPSLSTQKAVDAKDSKSKQSFDEKCKLINVQVIENSSNTSETEKTASEKQSKTMKETSSMDEKRTEFAKSKSIATVETKQKAITNFQSQCNITSEQLSENQKTDKKDLSENKTSRELPDNEQIKRRASEPPTTEDLENRFEALKRRMSSKTLNDNVNNRNKMSMKSETVDEALERIENDVFEDARIHKKASSVDKSKDEEVIKPVEQISPESKTLLGKQETVKRRASEPPTTEELEKRYETLKRRMSTKSEVIIECTQESMSSKNEEIETEFVSPNTIPESSTHIESVKSVSTNIPTPPPMQTKKSPSHLAGNQKDNNRRALVEELQSKMKPNDENLKPSDVNPNRKSSKKSTISDEISETHAITASMKLRNGEPWQMPYQKMVRRFSDLPSRSDLENRVHFLEQQLSLKYVKQRSASDSEVASRSNFAGLDEYNDGPSTSAKHHIGSDLEKRVMALEKQLSENSLKLVEAMRMKNKEEDHSDETISPEKQSAEVISPETTGKELVRYTHYGEIEETSTSKPINISINIKMHVNKEREEKIMKTVSLPTTAELEKRLEALEVQLTKSHNNINDDKSVIKEEALELDESKKDDLVGNIKSDIADATESTNKKGDERTLSDIRSKGEKFENENDQSNLNNLTSSLPMDNQTNISNNNDLFENSANTDTSQETSVPVATTQCKNNETETANDILEVDPLKNNADETNAIINKESDIANESAVGIAINAPENGQLDPNNKTLVLLLDNEPKAVKVRRLTRANTEELEDLFQALEKQLSERNLIKSEDGKLKRAPPIDPPITKDISTEESQAISELTKEIQEFADKDDIAHKEVTANEVKKVAAQDSSNQKSSKNISVDKENTDKDNLNKNKSEDNENFDWGTDPVKRHLKRKTAYLPSTKELEARYRSLERQIKLLEDVENIDVEQRLNEIERKIKLQYSLSHEKDLNKFLELCEGKLSDDEEPIIPSTQRSDKSTSPYNSPRKSRSRHTSPSRSIIKTPHTSPSRSREKSPRTTPSRSQERSPQTSPSPSRTTKINLYNLPARQRQDDSIPCIEDLEYRYRVLDLVRSKSKENLSSKFKHKQESMKQAIHPLEMLLDSSPDEDFIPSTGELEHRMRVLDGKPITQSPTRHRSRSPTIEDIKRQKLHLDRMPKTPIHNLETLVASPTKKDLPTEDELEARMRALEEDQKFDFKMQKNYKEFNQKLRDVISPSLSFEEFKTTKSREQSPKRPATPKSAMKDHESNSRRDENVIRSTSPKTIRFREDEIRRPKSYTEHRDADIMVGNADGVLKIIQENSKMLHRILKKTLADSSSSFSETTKTSEGLDVFGQRFMRETSPIRRTGTHTGIPLRTDDNINDRLNSIKDTIKSIDTLCEEKPYRKEKCQRYIDSLFSDSVYFASPSKKSSLEDLTYKRRSGDYAPSIHVSDHSQRPSDYYLSRSIGSAESIRSTSPLRTASPLHHRSTRDLRRDISPRRRRGDEEREEYDSRVRRVNQLPNYLLDDSSEFSRSSLTKFYKVDNELDTYKYDDKARSSSRSVSRSPLKSPSGLRETMSIANTINNSNTPTTTTNSNRLDWDRPVSPYRQTSHNLIGHDSLKRSTTPVYSPAKLEIRHTTVTSTFYDRLLTEKQIEKSLSRPPSRSPVVSPSITSKSYLDLPTSAGSATNAKSSENTPTTPLRSFGVTGFGQVGSGSTSYTGYSSSATAANAIDSTTTSISNTLNTATTPTGNSSALPHSYLARSPVIPVTKFDNTELRIKSCDNILMQLKSSSAGYASDLATTASSMPTGSIFTTNNNSAAITTTGSYTNLLNTTIPTTLSVAPLDMSSYRSNSTGEYDPLLPLNLRPVPNFGLQFAPTSSSADPSKS